MKPTTTVTLIAGLGLLGCAANQAHATVYMLETRASAQPEARAAEPASIPSTAARRIESINIELPPRPQSTGITLGSGSYPRVSPYATYDDRWPPPLVNWQPDPGLAFDYFHLGEVGGSWPLRARVDIVAEPAWTRAQLRELRRALAPHRRELEVCHLQDRQTNARSIVLTPAEPGVEAQVLEPGYRQDPAQVERCVMSALADFEWPSLAGAQLTLALSWR